MQSTEVWNIKQASRFLGVSANWLYLRALEGVIPSLKLGGGPTSPLRFYEKDIREYLEKCRRENPSPKRGERL